MEDSRGIKGAVCVTALSVRVKAAAQGMLPTSYQPHKHANAPLVLHPHTRSLSS